MTHHMALTELFSIVIYIILTSCSNANNRTGGTVRTGKNNSGKEKRKCNKLARPIDSSRWREKKFLGYYSPNR